MAFLLGIVAVSSRAARLDALILVFAAYVLVDAIVAATAALRAAEREDRWALLLLEAGFDLAAGGLALVYSNMGLLLFGTLAAVWALMSGAVLAAAGLQVSRRIGRSLMVLSGLVSIAWGVLLLLVPASSVIVLVWWLAAYGLVFGSLVLLLSSRLRPDPGD